MGEKVSTNKIRRSWERNVPIVAHLVLSLPSLARYQIAQLYRQRYQYILLLAGEHSMLTGERVSALGKLGFVWDSHTGAWNECFYKLRAYQNLNRHCNVPSTSEN
jgi:hypothetical protein